MWKYTKAIYSTLITAEKSRNGIFAELDPFVNMYEKDQSVDNILDDAINDLKGLQVHSNHLHPHKGHPFIYPSDNVMSGRQRTKRKNNCSIYNSKGHNAKNYDKKNCPIIIYNN